MQRSIQNFFKLAILILFFGQNILAGTLDGKEFDNSLSEDEKKAKIIENLKVVSAKAKPSLSGSNNSAAYITIKNENDQDVTILAAIATREQKANSSTIANNTELHTIATDANGVSRMVAVNRLLIPAKSTLVMEPGGIHVMLLNLKKPLDFGDKFYAKFILDKNIGVLQTEVTVGDVYK